MVRTFFGTTLLLKLLALRDFGTLEVLFKALSMYVGNNSNLILSVLIKTRFSTFPTG